MDGLQISVIYDQRGRDSSDKMGRDGMARPPQLWVSRTFVRRAKITC
jgi:hypothetical protein